MTIEKITRSLRRAVKPLTFSGEVTHVYNPLEYAWKPHARYLERFGNAPKEVLLIGMNPGPFGMAQTGVPFGEVTLVREWLGIDEAVKKPECEHPRRPIEGFSCSRSEVSGRRLWSWARERFTAPERFFARFYVHNYCPLVFMADTGRNITPDKLVAEERARLFLACDDALRKIVQALEPRLVVGVGAFAERRARDVLHPLDIRIERLLHPSPASPAANRGWAEAADRTFETLGVHIP